MGSAVTDAAVPGASLVPALAQYGALGVVLGVFLLVGIYAFKKMFDRFVDGVPKGEHLESIVDAIGGLRAEVVTEIRKARHEMMLYFHVGERSMTPLPELPLPVQHPRRPQGRTVGPDDPTPPTLPPPGGRRPR